MTHCISLPSSFSFSVDSDLWVAWGLEERDHVWRSHCGTVVVREIKGLVEVRRNKLTGDQVHGAQ